jgi:hypothetical protein
MRERERERDTHQLRHHPLLKRSCKTFATITLKVCLCEKIDCDLPLPLRDNKRVELQSSRRHQLKYIRILDHAVHQPASLASSLSLGCVSCPLHSSSLLPLLSQRRRHYDLPPRSSWMIPATPTFIFHPWNQLGITFTSSSVKVTSN